MSSMNKVILIGRVGQDPEIRYTGNGQAVANLSLATSEKWKDKETGDMQEHTEWHKLVAFNRTAEVIGEYVVKGSLISVEGKLNTRKWQDKSGVDRWTTSVHVDRMNMLGGKGDKPAAPQQQQGYVEAKREQAAEAPVDNFDDDIPF
jgi:single-strand DNA-binding protein